MFFSEILNTLIDAKSWGVDHIFTAVSLIFTVIAGIFAYRQWSVSNKIRKSEFINQILDKIRFDKELADMMYVIDYSVSWYKGHFQNCDKDFEFKMDKLLSYLSYICYLWKEKRITEKEFRVLKYEVNRVCNSYDVQSYLWNLYHFAKRNHAECSFQYLIDYGIKEKLIDAKTFRDPKSGQYEKNLNF